jgi:RNA polymerase sigma-70 factor (ECF subfamily)
VAAAFLRKLGVQDEAMEDACQEVFLQMFRYLPTYRGEADIKTWLYRLCATEAGNVRRRSRIVNTLRALILRSRDTEPATGQEFDSGLARKRVEAGLAALSPSERAVFVMFEMEGLAGEEIARIVECPVATVWRRLHYARQKFQERIEAGGRSAQ